MVTLVWANDLALVKKSFPAKKQLGSKFGSFQELSSPSPKEYTDRRTFAQRVTVVITNFSGLVVLPFCNPTKL